MLARPPAHRRPSARLVLAVTTAALLVACSSAQPELASTGDASPSAAATTTGVDPATSDAPTTDATTGASPTEASAAPTETAASEYAPSGPGGRYAAGDTYSDGEVLFTYEGLATVPLNSSGDYDEGACYFVLGTVEVLPGGPMAGDGGVIVFRPSLDPIFDGTADEEQSNEYFNCDVDPVTELGYVQGSVTELGVGETAKVWVDAIYESPERAGTLEAFRLFGMDDIAFTTEVTQDLTN